jgi:hypothetical protein
MKLTKSKKGMTVSTNSVIAGVFGAVLIFYLVASVFNDSASELESINESYKGGKLIKLLPLFLAFGIIIGVYKMLVTK